MPNLQTTSKSRNRQAQLTINQGVIGKNEVIDDSRVYEETDETEIVCIVPIVMVNISPEIIAIEFQSDYVTPPGGGTWFANIRGGAAGKSEKLPCPGVRFLKMIPCFGAKGS